MPRPENKPIIAVDIDDVVFPFVPGFVKFLDQYDIHVKEEHFTDYDLSKIYDIEKGQASELVSKFIRSQHMLTEPSEDSVSALEKLSESHEVIVLTARDRQFEKLTRQWFAKHFSQVVSRIHIVGEHYAAGGSAKAKAEACLQIGVEYLIDDLPYYINEAAAVGIRGLLFGDYAWNKNAEAREGVTRVKDWQEVLEYFDEESRRKLQK